MTRLTPLTKPTRVPIFHLGRCVGYRLVVPGEKTRVFVRGREEPWDYRPTDADAEGLPLDPRAMLERL